MTIVSRYDGMEPPNTSGEAVVVGQIVKSKFFRPATPVMSVWPLRHDPTDTYKKTLETVDGIS